MNELRARSIAWSDRLASSSGEAVRVGTLHGDGVIVIHHVFRMDNTLQIPEVGAHLPLHATALGKVLIAHHQSVADDLLAVGVTRLTHATVVGPAALRKMLDGVREKGWAAEREEAIIGEASIASPVFDRARRRRRRDRDRRAGRAPLLPPPAARTARSATCARRPAPSRASSARLAGRARTRGSRAPG